MAWVLDLDLDFFVRGLYGPAPLGQRPEAPADAAWDETRFRAFLQGTLDLKREAPTPGRLVETHDKALWLWRELLEQGRLWAPFSVVHVDAHSDLGIGRPGPAFVLEQVLARLPQARVALESYQRDLRLDEANYLLFALAFRWVDRLLCLHSPDSQMDVPREIDRGDTLHLSSALSRMLEGRNGPEPDIPFERLDGWRPIELPMRFDYVVVAHSPRYLPACADGLLDIVAEYLRPI